MAISLRRSLLFDGAKSIPLNALPEEAWRTIVGEREDGDIEKHYKAVAFLYRAIQVRAYALANLPWSLFKGEEVVWGSEEEEPPDTLLWLADLPELLYRTEASLCLTAEAFWFKDANRGGIVKSVRWLQPDSMTPKWDARQGLTHFMRQLGDQEIRLDREEVVYFYLPAALHETEPDSPPADAALAAAGVIHNVDLFAEQFFARGAIKATLLTVPPESSPQARLELKAWWQRFFKGIEDAWKTNVISTDVTPVTVGEGVGELSDQKLTTEKREDIATALGVPHSLVLSNASNFAVSQQDVLNLYNQTVVPSSQLIARQLNRQLLIPAGYRFQFEPEKMPLFQEDEEQRSQSFAHYVNAGMPMSVAAEILGIDLPEGMEYADLDPEPEPEPEPQPVQLQQAQPTTQPVQPGQPAQPSSNGDMRAEEMRRFRRWARKRSNPDANAFASDVLTEADKAAVLAELEDGAPAMRPFRPYEAIHTGR